MSWFEYGTPKYRRSRIGVWLRLRHLPKNIINRINKRKRFFEIIRWVKILEIRPNNMVLLEAWCSRPAETDRHTVITFLEKEDPKWVCEGDMGRGYKGD